MLNRLDISRIESNGKSYCRSFPVTFDKSCGIYIHDTKGNQYIDFLSGCGSLNYGHNHPKLKKALLEYIKRQGIVMSLDLDTESKRNFLEAFSVHILNPRQLNYKIQFPGPTGANAVEAAIKLARKATGRTNVIAFTNAFHGCSLGALALTGSAHHRDSSTPLLTNVSRLPYDGYFGTAIDTAAYLEKMLSDPSGGCDKPAAIIFETIQGEGGLNVASSKWAQDIQRIARAHGALVIVDDIQAGCGRSGDFFSFEALGIEPDIICLAKSISGFGLPMSLVLLKPEWDVWEPGEHNGTFRGNNYAFVTATAAIELFWKDDAFSIEIKRKTARLKTSLRDLAMRNGLTVKGRGLMLGIDFASPAEASRVRTKCFENGLIVEGCGPHDEILKLLPPLTVSDKTCDAALAVLQSAMTSFVQ